MFPRLLLFPGFFFATTLGCSPASPDDVPRPIPWSEGDLAALRISVQKQRAELLRDGLGAESPAGLKPPEGFDHTVYVQDESGEIRSRTVSLDLATELDVLDECLDDIVGARREVR